MVPPHLLPRPAVQVPLPPVRHHRNVHYKAAVDNPPPALPARFPLLLDVQRRRRVPVHARLRPSLRRRARLHLQPAPPEGGLRGRPASGRRGRGSRGAGAGDVFPKRLPPPGPRRPHLDGPSPGSVIGPRRRPIPPPPGHGPLPRSLQAPRHPPPPRRRGLPGVVLPLPLLRRAAPILPPPSPGRLGLPPPPLLPPPLGPLRLRPSPPQRSLRNRAPDPPGRAMEPSPNAF
mmetsp:Transcript_6540/g.12586  ORF Transcript_6540/g.12586 Transcript_6540/m.12586 type:complete len:231 (+) Transcript_6540:343-1035(+)